MKILKFGGSSLANPDRVRAVAGIVSAASRSGDVVVVVSAFGGVTDALLRCARSAETRDESYRQRLEELRTRHQDAADALASPSGRSHLVDRITGEMDELGELLHGVAMVREASPRTLDRILSTGEKLSAAIVASALRAAGMSAQECDARRLIVTGPEFGHARVDEAATEARVRRHFESERATQVVTGFIAATADDETTTLGRGGSDYTAAILGGILGAEAVELWTDVDGVLSADPRVVPDAILTRQLSYDELMELSHFGAKVVFPPSVHPARSRSIPLWIKNTFRPDSPGTLVSDAIVEDPRIGTPVRGIASIDSVVLMRLEGDGMIGVPGIAMRLFGALARSGASVILISQGSSEHSICFAVAPEVRAAAARAIEEEFSAERRAGLIEDLVIEQDVSIVAVVGAGMRERSGVAGRLFNVLGRHGINVRAIAQGSSELNISLVVASADAARAVAVIHDAFFLPGWRTVDITLAGIGRVGSALLRQLAEQREALAHERGLRLRLVGVACSRGALLDPAGLDPATALERIRAQSGLAEHGEMLEAVRRDRGAQRVFVDCTASARIAEHYQALLESGVAVVTANKQRLAGPLKDFRDLTRAAPGRVYYETTVGAALPVIGTLRDLLSTGDRITRIEGIFSGTLGFLLSEVAAGRGFSESVRLAHSKGYTEPDPREDLGGRDVARKLLILAHMAGLSTEPQDVQTRPLLVDESWEGLSLDEFWSRLPELDEPMARLQRKSVAEGAELRYLATLTDGSARVGLESIPPEHPCASARGTDNLIALTSRRYSDAPLIVQGPGAGPELTASGVFADILRAVAEGEGDGR